jgi:hypothetical protein
MSGDFLTPWSLLRRKFFCASRLGTRQEPFRPHRELAVRLSLPSFPSSQRIVVHENSARGVPLRNFHRRPTGNPEIDTDVIEA